MPIGALFSAPAYALMPLAAVLAARGVPLIVPLVAGGVLFSFGVVVYNVAQVSFRQRLCPPALLGRMNASIRFLVWGPMPLGGLLGGWLGTHLGVTPTLWVAAAGMGVGRAARRAVARCGGCGPCPARYDAGAQSVVVHDERGVVA